MPLTDIEIQVGDKPLPDGVRHVIAEAKFRIDAFIERRLDDPIPGFVPSDFAAVYRVLECLRERHLAPGPAFCEWGSGFGVVALLASMSRYQACGIEIERALVEEASRLAAHFKLPVQFIRGSFLPETEECLVVTDRALAWLDDSGPSAYRELGLDPADFDVIFAYPWPGEEPLVTDLFERHAASGALLVTYEREAHVRVRRKAPGSRTRSASRTRRAARTPRRLA